jgi:hypothetical protein
LILSWVGTLEPVSSGKEHVQKLLKGAKGKPVKHPQFPKDKTMQLYKVLSSAVQGVKRSFTDRTGYEAKGKAPAIGNIAENLQAAAEKDRKKIPKINMVGENGGSDDEDGDGKKKKNPKKEPKVTQNNVQDPKPEAREKKVSAKSLADEARKRKLDLKTLIHDISTSATTPKFHKDHKDRQTMPWLPKNFWESVPRFV